LAVGLNETEAALYFHQRASQGFNAVLMDDVIQFSWSPKGPADSNGNLPFTANLPGSSNFDITKPNPAYWQHIDNLLTMASQNGLEVLFDVYDNYNGFLAANPTANFTAYGRFLGQRYASFDNIIWMFGNDYFETAQVDAQMAALIQGIRQFDTRHLMTLEGWYTSAAPQTSFDNPNLRQYMDVNGIYWYLDLNGPFRPEYLAQYNGSDFGPNINIESGYQYRADLGVTPSYLREEHYSFLLNGAAGDIYGNEKVGGAFSGGPFASDWQAQMTSQGDLEMSYFASFLRSVAWHHLVPDQNGAVFQGVGSPADYSGAWSR